MIGHIPQAYSQGTDSQDIRLAYIDFDGIDYTIYLYLDYNLTNHSKKEICWIVRFRQLPDDITLRDISFEDFKKESDKSVVTLSNMLRKRISEIHLEPLGQCLSATEQQYTSTKTFDFSDIGRADVYKIGDREILSSFLRDCELEDDNQTIEKYLDRNIVVFKVRADEVHEGLVPGFAFGPNKLLSPLSETETADNKSAVENVENAEPENESSHNASSKKTENVTVPLEADSRRTYDDPVVKIERETYWIDEETNIVAIDPTQLGGVITSPYEVSIENIGIKYMDYESFVLVPDDGIPSMVLIFSKGSLRSTLYMDNDARELLDSKESKIEIVGTKSLNVRKPEIKKVDNTRLYSIDVRDIRGSKNLKRTLDNEIMTGNKVIYPHISRGESKIEGSKVIIKESRDISLFEIRSISDLLLWINLRFNMNLDNKEKGILQDGIYATLEKAVEENTA